jgi:2-keto-3-deoxy-L-rhamnonate aldolase RhmA
MRVRASVTLDIDVKSPSEAAKLLEPILANVPRVEQFSMSIKGMDYYPVGKRVNGRRAARAIAVDEY